MNASDAAPIARYAARQIKNDRVGCILQANLVAEMARAVVERDAALERLAKIAIAARRGQYALADHGLEEVGGRFVEIEELAHFDT